MALTAPADYQPSSYTASSARKDSASADLRAFVALAACYCSASSAQAAPLPSGSADTMALVASGHYGPECSATFEFSPSCSLAFDLYDPRSTATGGIGRPHYPCVPRWMSTFVLYYLSC